VADDVLEEVQEPVISVTEHKVIDWPGWTRIQSGNTRRYRSPGGLEVSNARWIILSQKYRGQKFIPEAEILPKPKPQPTSFFSTKTERVPSGQQKFMPETPSKQKEETPLDLPDARPRVGSKPQGGRASARELGDSFQTTLLIATALVALLTKFPDLAMTEMEAKGIAIPLANILEKSKINERFGRMIANSGDYQLLGYALYLYLDRVGTAVNVRRNNVRQQFAQPVDTSSISNATGAGGVQPSAGNGYQSSGANLPYAPTSGGRVTPITRQG